VVGFITGLLLLGSTALPLRDVDLYWHLRAGDEILGGMSLHTVGTTWSFAPDPMPWVTTQWMAEVFLALLHEFGSWSALVEYRTVTAALTVAILAYATLRGRPVILAAFPFLIAAVAAINYSQERPNQATLVGAAALGAVLLRGLTEGRLPRWWLLLPLTWLWANYHGGWVLAPGILILIALGRSLDHGLRDRLAVRALALAVASLVVGTLSPAGTGSTLAVLRFSSATETIQEWQRTAPLEGAGRFTLAMLVVVAFGWTRSRMPKSEALAVVLLMVFSWAAIRNVAPALLILAPLVANGLCRNFPAIGQHPEPRWSQPLGIGIASALLLVGIATIPGRDHLPSDAFPVGLASQIGALPGAQRVLNHYNTAGFVLWFAGSDDQVGIDGRSDRYGADYINSYTDLLNLKGEWSQRLAELAPSVALLKSDSPLGHVLPTERGWDVVDQEGEWVLLKAGPNTS
jgi:hypothetical protein